MLMPCSMLHWRQVEHGRHGWLGPLAAWLPLFFFATILERCFSETFGREPCGMIAGWTGWEKLLIGISPEWTSAETGIYRVSSETGSKSSADSVQLRFHDDFLQVATDLSCQWLTEFFTNLRPSCWSCWSRRQRRRHLCTASRTGHRPSQRAVPRELGAAPWGENELMRWNLQRHEIPPNLRRFSHASLKLLEVAELRQRQLQRMKRGDTTVLLDLLDVSSLDIAWSW